MNILLMAPQPFYQERGTPIAVRHLISALCEAGHRVDLVTYPEGQDVEVKGLEIHRIPKIPFIKNIPIGFSWKKLVYDFFMAFQMLQMVHRRRYDVIHAVEESIFIALMLPRHNDTKLIYDMDSSMSDQLIEKWSSLRILRRCFNAFERLAIRRSDIIISVCEALSERVKKDFPEKKIHVIQDVGIGPLQAESNIEDLRNGLGINGLIALYVGNLEHYQGVNLILEAMAALWKGIDLHLVIIGGNPQDVAKYKTRATALNISDRAHFLGSRPLSQLAVYLKQADILVSSRIKGQNTPMKIYSYLASGRPILATNIRSHTQVLDSSCALLVEPSAEALANGLQTLVQDVVLRRKLGGAGAAIAQEHYTYEVFRQKLLNAYALLDNSREA